MKRRSALISLGLAIIVPARASATVPPADKVSLRADWLLWAGHVPYVVGKYQGVFANNGIDLELVPGAGSADSVKLVATGAYKMALASGANVIMARAQGLPIRVVGIIYQWDPWGFMWLPEAKISTIQDFKGKRIANTKASATYTEMLAVLKKHGIHPNRDVTLVNVQPGGVTQAVALGLADIGNIMIFRDNFALQRIIKRTPVVLPLKDLGVNIYGMTVIANESFLNEKPDIVGRVVKSVYQSWEMVFMDPARSVDTFHKLALLADQDKPAAETKRELEAIIPFVKGDVYRTHGLGWSDKTRWQEAVDILLDQKVIEQRPDVGTMFTNQFVTVRSSSSYPR